VATGRAHHEAPQEARVTSPFDRIAGAAAALASRAPFFVGCVFVVLLWAISFPLFSSTDTQQLLINSTTTIVTFLLVALLQNTQRRSEVALQPKLDATADGLADLMEHQLQGDSVDPEADIADLKAHRGGLTRSAWLVNIW
jgi:hypothetical protein